MLGKKTGLCRTTESHSISQQGGGGACRWSHTAAAGMISQHAGMGGLCRTTESQGISQHAGMGRGQSMQMGCREARCFESCFSQEMISAQEM